MGENQIENSDLLNEVIDKLMTEILNSYKADESSLFELISGSIKSNKDLISIIKKENDFKKVARTRAYKDFSNKIKRNLYSQLRRYYQDVDDIDEIADKFKKLQRDDEESKNYIKSLLQYHVSTRERLADFNNFYEPIKKYIMESKKIIDIGCGLNPLMVPFNADGSKVEKYIAVDKDNKSIKILKAYSDWLGDDKLAGVNWDLKEGWQELYKKTGIELYDMAFIMKVLPVVKRQERELLSVLRDTPANLLLITGSKTSMTKNSSIEKRERKDIDNFIDECGFTKLLEFDRSEEFGWLVRKT